MAATGQAVGAAGDDDPLPSPSPPVLAVLLLGSTLTVMAGAVLSPVLALLRNDLGIGATAAGLVLTAHGLVVGVASPVVGWLIDRFGVRAVLFAGLLVYGLSGGAGLVAGSFTGLIVSRLVFGVGVAAVFTGTTVALLDVYSGRRRDQVMGWRTTAISLGGLAWPLAAGVLGAVSWQAPFGLYLLGVPLALAVLQVLPRLRPPASPAVGIAPTLALVRRRPVILGFYAMFAVGSVLLYAVLVFLPLRLGEVGVEQPLAVGVATSSLSGAMSVVGLAYGRLRTRLDHRTLLGAAHAGMLLAFLLLAAGSNQAVLVAAPALLGAGLGITVPALTVLTGDAALPAMRGQILSLSATATFLGQFVSPLLFGPLVEATSIRTGFLAAAALAGIVLIVVMGSARRLEPQGSR